MNRSILYILFVVSLMFMMGCKNEQENLFSEPAAVRLNSALETIDSTLTIAPNGWLMQYFATSESPGYSMLVKFYTNGEVKVAAKNELFNNNYSEAKSLYDVIGDNGPVLTFNTFNQVLHVFSSPINPAGAGLEGDYEFVVNHYADSIIYLKGKKRATAIELHRLASGENWTNYFEDLDKINNNLFGVDPIYFVTGRDTILAYNGASHVFEFQQYGVDTTTQIPFIITKNGLKLYTPYVTAAQNEVQWFTLSDDCTKLIADNNKNIYFSGSGIGAYFIDSHETYAFDTTQMSDKYLVPVRELFKQMNVKYSGKRNVDFLALSYKQGFGNSFYISTTPTITVANFKINLLPDSSNPNVISIKREEGVFDQNGAVFYSAISAIETLWKELDGTYQINSTLSKEELKFVDVSNKTRFFVVKKK